MNRAASLTILLVALTLGFCATHKAPALAPGRDAQLSLEQQIQESKRERRRGAGPLRPSAPLLLGHSNPVFPRLNDLPIPEPIEHDLSENKTFAGLERRILILAVPDHSNSLMTVSPDAMRLMIVILLSG